MDLSGVGGGRRRTVPRCSAEDQALDQIAKEVRFILKLISIWKRSFL